MLAMIIPAWLEGLSVWWVTGVIGICLYWLPLIVCLIVYSIKGIKLYFKLREERCEGAYPNSDYFAPDQLTLGHILFFLFISTCPVINLIAFLKETAWETLSYLFRKITNLFSFSLVPDSNKYQEIRKNKVSKNTK